MPRPRSPTGWPGGSRPFSTAPPGLAHPYRYLERYYLTFFDLAGPEAGTLATVAGTALDPTLSKAELTRSWLAVDTMLIRQQYDTPICFLNAFWVLHRDVRGAAKMTGVWGGAFDRAVPGSAPR